MEHSVHHILVLEIRSLTDRYTSILGGRGKDIYRMSNSFSAVARLLGRMLEAESPAARYTHTHNFLTSLDMLHNLFVKQHWSFVLQQSSTFYYDRVTSVYKLHNLQTSVWISALILSANQSAGSLVRILIVKVVNVQYDDKNTILRLIY